MLLKTSLVFRSGSNSLMFANYSVFGDAREVRSFVLCQKEMFGYDWISALKISKHFGHFFIKKFHEQFKFWWCSWGLKFSFGPKWDVWMCLMFDLLKFGMFKVRFLLFDPPLIVLSFHQSITNLSSYQHIMYLHYN